MRFHYDKKKDALYIRLDESPYGESNEIEEGVIFDYNKSGKLTGIEILDASRRLSRHFYTQILQKSIPLRLEMRPLVK